MADTPQPLAVRVEGAQLANVAQTLKDSRLFGVTSPAAAQALIMAGAELGIGPIASLTGIYLVQGRVTFSAQSMASALKHSGRYSYRIRTHTDQECAIEFRELDPVSRQWEVVGVSAFTMADAKRAGLLGKSGPWHQYPRAMLYARAMSQGVRWYAPDVFNGAPAYTPDELGAGVTMNADGEITDVTDAEFAATPVGPTLEDLLERYGAEEIMAAFDGGIPATDADVALVAARLEGRDG